MTATFHLDALVARLRADVVSGAAVVGRMAAELARRAALQAPADTPEGLRAVLADVLVRVLDTQPSMAPLVSLGRHVLGSLEEAPSVESAREAAAAAAESFRAGLETRAQVVAARAASLLPERGTVMTVSSSSTVRGALLDGAQTRDLRVVCLESRPMNEGRLLATKLAGAGLEVLYAADAAADSIIPECDVVLLGADSIGDRGVVNKIGSAGIAAAAQREGVPVHVATDESKILPPGFPQLTADDRPPDEVWRAPAGVRVWNRYFEDFPLAWVTSVVTESATLPPDEVEEIRTGIALPAELREWAARRSRAAGHPSGA